MVYVFKYWRKYGAELSKDYPYSGEVCTSIAIIVLYTCIT